MANPVVQNSGPPVRAVQAINRVPLKVPDGQPVDPRLLNTHLRLITDTLADHSEAFTALTYKIQAGQAPTGTINANSSASVVVPLPKGFVDLNYSVTVGVTGNAKLTAGSYTLGLNNVTVTVTNSDSSPHTGTVVVQAIHF